MPPPPLKYVSALGSPDLPARQHTPYTVNDAIKLYNCTRVRVNRLDAVKPSEHAAEFPSTCRASFKNRYGPRYKLSGPPPPQTKRFYPAEFDLTRRRPERRCSRLVCARAAQFKLDSCRAVTAVIKYTRTRSYLWRRRHPDASHYRRPRGPTAFSRRARRSGRPVTRTTVHKIQSIPWKRTALPVYNVNTRQFCRPVPSAPRG